MTRGSEVVNGSEVGFQDFTPEQRTQLILRLLSKEEPGAQIARRAGISEQTLYRWRDEFIRGGSAGLAGRGSADVQAKELAKLHEQLSERDQVIGEITVANRISFAALWLACTFPCQRFADSLTGACA